MIESNEKLWSYGTDKKYSQDELSVAFDFIHDPHDWRAPINAKIPKSMYDICAAACLFYTATQLIVKGLADGDYIKVTATGYRNGPAGP